MDSENAIHRYLFTHCCCDCFDYEAWQGYTHIVASTDLSNEQIKFNVRSENIVFFQHGFLRGNMFVKSSEGVACIYAYIYKGEKPLLSVLKGKWSINQNGGRLQTLLQQGRMDSPGSFVSLGTPPEALLHLASKTRRSGAAAVSPVPTTRRT